MISRISLTLIFAALLLVAPALAQPGPPPGGPANRENELSPDERKALRKHMKHRQKAMKYERKAMKHRMMAREFGREFREEHMGDGPGFGPMGFGPQWGPPQGQGPMAQGPMWGPPAGPGPQGQDFMPRQEMRRNFRHQQFAPQMPPDHPWAPQHLRRHDGHARPRAM